MFLRSLSVAAILVLRSGRHVERSELHGFVAEPPTSWKRLRRWRIVTEIPRTSPGKATRGEIASRWTESSLMTCR